MKRDTIQTIFEMITLDECSFRNNYVTIYSNYEEYTLDACFDISESDFETCSIWLGETELNLDQGCKNSLILRICELQAEYIENEKELNELRKDFYHDLDTRPYLK